MRIADAAGRPWSPSQRHELAGAGWISAASDRLSTGYGQSKPDFGSRVARGRDVVDPSATKRFHFPAFRVKECARIARRSGSSRERRTNDGSNTPRTAGTWVTCTRRDP